MHRSFILFSTFALFLSGFDLAHAKSSKRAIEFTSSVDGATVTVMKYRSASRKTLSKCETPCTVELKPSKMGIIFFTHPDYPFRALKRSDYEKLLDSDKETVSIHGHMGATIEARKAEQEAKYNATAETQRLKGQAAPKPWTRIPPMFPRQKLEQGRAAWCEVRFSVLLDGTTKNAVAFNCSEKGFEKASENSLSKWRYIPRVENGKFVRDDDVTTLITFAFTDENGKPSQPRIPAPDSPASK